MMNASNVCQAQEHSEVDSECDNQSIESVVSSNVETVIITIERKNLLSFRIVLHEMNGNVHTHKRIALIDNV